MDGERTDRLQPRRIAMTRRKTARRFQLQVEPMERRISLSHISPYGSKPGGRGEGLVPLTFAPAGVGSKPGDVGDGVHRDGSKPGLSGGAGNGAK
jgi:hypothetical protein